jgi:hypothetical protein
MLSASEDDVLAIINDAKWMGLVNTFFGLAAELRTHNIQVTMDCLRPRLANDDIFASAVRILCGGDRLRPSEFTATFAEEIRAVIAKVDNASKATAVGSAISRALDGTADGDSVLRIAIPVLSARLPHLPKPVQVQAMLQADAIVSYFQKGPSDNALGKMVMAFVTGRLQVNRGLKDQVAARVPPPKSSSNYISELRRCVGLDKQKSELL